jgi:hypothetical protein
MRGSLVTANTSGLLCRFVPLGLPYVIVKYGGSFLWAATVYWCIAFIAARLHPSAIAVIAVVISAVVEFIKRVQSRGLDAFRDTFAGKVFLGRHFSYIDIAVYWCAILCTMWIDHRAIHERQTSKE